MPTKIQWCDEVWNPVVGCTKVSEGCKNCYAERMAGRLANIGHEKYKYVTTFNSCPRKVGSANWLARWNNNIFCDESALDKPLHWRNPRRIFVCSMGDLFHEKVPFEFIDKVMETIAMWPQQHTFQILTKRPEVALEYFKQLYAGLTKFHKGKKFQWPFKNVWLGVSVENNKNLWRIEELLKIPAAVRFVSIEPMLDKIKLNNINTPERTLDALRGKSKYFVDGNTPYYGRFIDWVIIGCESGPKRRECELKWIRDIVQQCKAADVPVFVKQIPINGKVSKDPAEWPVWASLREYPKGGKDE